MKYRKKPVEIEAKQIVNDNNIHEVAEWCNGVVRHDDNGKAEIHIETLEGTMAGQIKDYIIKGIKGEFYPCRPDIFEESYDPVK